MNSELHTNFLKVKGEVKKTIMNIINVHHLEKEVTNYLSLREGIALHQINTHSYFNIKNYLCSLELIDFTSVSHYSNDNFIKVFLNNENIYNAKEIIFNNCLGFNIFNVYKFAEKCPQLKKLVLINSCYDQLSTQNFNNLYQIKIIVFNKCRNIHLNTIFKFVNKCNQLETLIIYNSGFLLDTHICAENELNNILDNDNILNLIIADTTNIYNNFAHSFHSLVNRTNLQIIYLNFPINNTVNITYNFDMIFCMLAKIMFNNRNNINFRIYNFPFLNYSNFQEISLVKIINAFFQFLIRDYYHPVIQNNNIEVIPVLWGGCKISQNNNIDKTIINAINNINAEISPKLWRHYKISQDSLLANFPKFNFITNSNELMDKLMEIQNILIDDINNNYNIDVINRYTFYEYTYNLSDRGDNGLYIYL